VTLDQEAIDYLKFPNPLKVDAMECPLCEECNDIWDQIYHKWQVRCHRDKNWWIKGWVEFMNLNPIEVFVLS